MLSSHETESLAFLVRVLFVLLCIVYICINDRHGAPSRTNLTRRSHLACRGSFLVEVQDILAESTEKRCRLGIEQPVVVVLQGIDEVAV